jgi:hypothetical protein
MIATLKHLEKLNFDNANGWLWTVVYVGIPPLLLVLGALQLRQPGGDPPRRQPIERWIYPVVFLLLLVTLVVGASLFFAPSTADALWPWTLTPLTSGTVGAWLLALAAGLASVLYERDWQRVRVAVPTFFAMAVLQAIALARYSGTVDWSSVQTWLYLAGLATLFLLGGVGLARIRAHDTPPEPSPASA